MSTARTAIVLYAKSGALGHAAMANSYAALLRRQGYDVQTLDLLEHDCGPDIDAALALYFRSLTAAPWLWRNLYSYNSAIPGLYWGKTELLPRRFRRTIEQLKGSNPSLIVSVHPLATAIASFLKGQRAIGARLIAVFPDWHFQPFWLFPNVDGYLVVTDRQVHAMVNLGVTRNKIAEVGILVNECYYQELDRQQCRRELEILSSDPVVLVMSGGIAWRMEHFVNLVCSLECAASVYVIGAPDHLMFRLESLARNGSGRGPKLHFRGHTHALPYFGAADVFLGKPGISVVEALAIGIPTVLAFPVPGHEERNLQELLAFSPVAVIPKSGQAAFLRHVVSNASSWRVQEREATRRAARECPGRAMEAIERFADPI